LISNGPAERKDRPLPNANEQTKQGGYKTWQILVAICFFPVGLLALLADKNPCHMRQLQPHMARVIFSLRQLAI